MTERISVKKAIELARLSQLSIRLGLQCGHLSFGVTIKTSQKKEQYIIYHRYSFERTKKLINIEV